jgi:hypothetical protein
MAILVKKWKFPVVSAAAVLMTQRMEGHCEEKRSHPSWSVMCGNTAWIGTGKILQAVGVVASTVA